jgi:hypothetical protein
MSFITRLDHGFNFYFLQVNARSCLLSLIWRSFRTASGTFTDGELRLNQSGLRLISEKNGDVSVSSLDLQGLLLSFIDSCNCVLVECTSYLDIVELHII